MVTLGDGKYTYALSGTNWGNLPAGANYKEATSVAVDSQDNVYVFNRGTHPIVVYDSEGNVLHTWGHGIFDTPHGVAVGPDDSVYCIDSGDHTVRKFTPEGEAPHDARHAGPGAAADERRAVQSPDNCRV